MSTLAPRTEIVIIDDVLSDDIKVGLKVIVWQKSGHSIVRKKFSISIGRFKDGIHFSP